MNARRRNARVILAHVFVCLVVILPLLLEPLAAWAEPLAIPDNCSGETIVLIQGDDPDNPILTIESPQISNAGSTGCNVSGQMHLRLAGNDVPGTPITGKVDYADAFSSSSIGAFSLPIAGLTLKVGADGSSFGGGKLTLNNPKIKIPDDWGGLEATVPQAFTVDNNGLKAYTFSLPAIKTKKLTLELWGDLGVYGQGYSISAHGALMLPDIGKSEECYIKVDVTLYVDAFGYTVMEIQTPGADQPASLSAHRSEIALPAGQAALTPASMPLQSSYLSVPDSLPEEVWQQLQNEDPAPADQNLPESSDVLGTGEWIPAPAQDWAWAEDGSADEDALYNASFDGLSPFAALGPVAGPAELAQEPGAEPAAPELGWGGLEITAGWKCMGKGIPIGTTGFELTSVEGQVTLMPYEESVRLKVTFDSMLKVASLTAMSIDGEAFFQWSPEFAFSLGGAITVLSMFEVGGAQVSVSESDGLRVTVWWDPVWPPLRADFALHAWLTKVTSCAAWSTVCLDHHPLDPTCTSTCSDWDTQTKFHFTGSASCQVGFEQGELWSGSILPYPCHCRWCRKWIFYYPCCSWCWVTIDIPPFDIWLAGVGAQFGEFTGDRWGLKGTVSFLAQWSRCQPSATFGR